MSKLTLPQVVEKVEQLPELPQVLLRLTQMMENPDMGATELATVIRLDENLTSQMLRLCNSASFGLNRKILSVKDATPLLGFQAIKSMIYTILAQSAFNQQMGDESVENWRQCLTCAVYAKEVANQFRLADPEPAFTGAILKDVGKLLMQLHLGSEYGKVERACFQQGNHIVSTENQQFGVNQCLAGARVAEKWKLPEDLVNIIKFHHSPADMTVLATQMASFKLLTAVHIADVFTIANMDGVGPQTAYGLLDQEALKKCMLTLDVEKFTITYQRLQTLNSTVEDLMNAFGVVSA